MILNTFHTRQKSTTGAPVSSSLHQRRDSYQYQQDPFQQTSHFQPTSQTYPSEVDEKTPPSTPNKTPVPSWSNMPHKIQLLILALSRLVDFWQMASLQSYMVFQLRSFDTALPSSVISYQAGVLTGAFTFAQIVTSILWGRAADSPSLGRKNVLLIGLVGTGISCIGVGFSSKFWEAVVWRVLGGAVNGSVGAARTMVAESVGREWHSRAFLTLPVAFNVANVLGPVVGGLLVNPVSAYPTIFGANSILGKSKCIQWMTDYPYALPAILCTILLFSEAVLVSLFLQETLPSTQDCRRLSDQFIDMYTGIKDILSGQPSYTALEAKGPKRQLFPQTQTEKGGLSEGCPPTQRLPFRKIWTPNVLTTLLSVAIFDFHMGAFSSLWTIFLSSPRHHSISVYSSSKSPSISHPKLDLHQFPSTGTPSLLYFTGGLNFSPSSLGISLSILGTVGLLLQLALYPWANGRFGLMRCFRLSLFLFPLAYFLAPYLVLLPSSAASPLQASGVWLWLGISLILTLQVSARTFALPASIILVNNASPHPSVLGTIHGVGQSVSAGFRTLGPVASGYWYGVGLEHECVGFSWWMVAGISVIGCIASFWARDGSQVLVKEEEQFIR